MRLFHLLWLFVLWLNLNKSFQQNEIKCTIPIIENGYVLGDIQEYREHDVLHFVCNAKYKSAENRTSKCTKLGIRADWIPTPVCESLKCKLPSTPLGTRYEPPYRNVFSPGDNVRVICGEKYGISNHRDTSAVTTCNDDGEWTLRPICLEVICSNPRDNLVYYWYDNWRQPTKLDETVRYTCRSGYRSTDGATRATCTREGWRPNPLCQEITCSRLEIANAILNDDRQIYKNYEMVNYVCEKGYRGSPNRTCGENGWRGDSQCTALKCKLPSTPLGTRYEPPYRNVFSPGDTIRVICGEKYGISNHRDPSAVTTCDDDGEWTLRPICLEVICSNPRDNLVYYWYDNWRQPTKLDETVRYTCRSGYRSTDGATRATCTREGWRPNPLCQELVDCGTPPVLADGDLKYTMKSKYSYNETVEYTCQEYYTMEGEPYRTCLNGEWTGHMRCLKPCVLNEDDIRQHNITLKSGDKKYLSHDEMIEFKCARGIPAGAVAMRQRCNGGVILLPTCQ